ncbi:MAG: SGNH/GDSL hydrolase family protein [Anaerolineales bacterium]|nr:SGNH/GDSL hydrolase family protein [Anaerolineales bacterium]
MTETPLPLVALETVPASSWTAPLVLSPTPERTPTEEPSPTAIPSPTFTLTKTFTPTATVRPTLGPNEWQYLPIIPQVSETARQIYRAGQVLGNDPHAFSIIGDCLSLPINMFGNYGQPGRYNLGPFSHLQPVIDWFQPSFRRISVTLRDGFNTAAVLSPLRADPKLCQPNETPLVCEYRIHRPSYVFISIGTDDFGTPPEVYEKRMRQIVEYTISQGIVPILATKADNREGDHAFNRIVAQLAYEYDVPLWNFWAAVQPLKYGVLNDRGHLYWADPNHLEYQNSMMVAVPVRAATALQALDAVWRGVTSP